LDRLRLNEDRPPADTTAATAAPGRSATKIPPLDIFQQNRQIKNKAGERISRPLYFPIFAQNPHAVLGAANPGPGCSTHLRNRAGSRIQLATDRYGTDIYEHATQRLPDDILDNYLKFLYFLVYSFTFDEGKILAKLFQAGKQMTDAILTVMKYVSNATGIEPSQEEIANALKSYFILNEIGNQIKFQRKNPLVQDQPVTSSKDPFWKLNLMAGPPKNSLVRVGLFYEDMQVAFRAAQNFVKKFTGAEPSEEEIALSIKCNFILSEIKNQIDWQRQGPNQGNQTESKPGQI
jgi:hypothetical protein